MSFEPGSAVQSIDNPGRRGVVTNASPRVRPSGTYRQVSWSNGQIDWCHEAELEAVDSFERSDPFALAHAGSYGRAADLRRNLTYVHLSGRLANLVWRHGSRLAEAKKALADTKDQIKALRRQARQAANSARSTMEKRAQIEKRRAQRAPSETLFTIRWAVA